MARVVWTEPAIAQLEAIAGVIELDKPSVARAVVRQIWKKADRLAAFPRLGRAIPEFRRPGYRQLWIRPCWVYYRHTDETVFILHIRRAEKRLDLCDLA